MRTAGAAGETSPGLQILFLGEHLLFTPTLIVFFPKCGQEIVVVKVDGLAKNEQGQGGLGTRPRSYRC